MSISDPYLTDKKKIHQNFELILHRGRNIHSIENSIAGIEEIRSLTKKYAIEIDILSTKDDIAILFHDITLNRSFGINKTVFDYTFSEINLLSKSRQIPSLQEILDIFPDQKFFLDIRTDLHPDLFLDSDITPADININTKEKLINSLKKINLEKYNNNINVLCGTLKDKQYFENHFTNIKIEVAERYARDWLDQFKETENISFLGKNPSIIFIHIRRLSKVLVDQFHKKGIRVIATPPTRDQSIEKSLTMIKKCFEFGADGILTSHVDANIVSMIENINGSLNHQTG